MSRHLVRCAIAAAAASAACYDATTFPTDPLASAREGPFAVVNDTTSAPRIERCVPAARRSGAAAESATFLVALRAPTLRICPSLDDAAHVGPLDEWPASMPGCTCEDR